MPARTASKAASRSSPWASSLRSRSSPRKPAWPSLVWKTSASTPNASRARTPPSPRSSSWRSRCSLPPPYSRSVTARSAGPFSGTSASSSSRVTCRRAPSRSGRAGSRRGTGARRAAARRPRRGRAPSAARRGRARGSAPAASRPPRAAGRSTRCGRTGRRRKRHAEVAGRLEVVAGEHAEAAGVLRQHLAHPELGREVGDGLRRVGQRRPPARLLLEPLERAGGVVQPVRGTPGPAASSCSRSDGTWFSRRRAFRPAASNPSGSIEANSAWARGSQVECRFDASTRSGARASGSAAPTVMRRRGFIGRDCIDCPCNRCSRVGAFSKRGRVSRPPARPARRRLVLEPAQQRERQDRPRPAAPRPRRPPSRRRCGRWRRRAPADHPARRPGEAGERVGRAVAQAEPVGAERREREERRHQGREERARAGSPAARSAGPAGGSPAAPRRAPSRRRRWRRGAARRCRSTNRPASGSGDHAEHRRDGVDRADLPPSCSRGGRAPAAPAGRPSPRRSRRPRPARSPRHQRLADRRELAAHALVALAPASPVGARMRERGRGQREQGHREERDLGRGRSSRARRRPGRARCPSRPSPRRRRRRPRAVRAAR